MTDVKGRWINTVTVPGNTLGFKIRAPFVPDWWRISLPSSVANVLAVYPGSLSRIGSLPLTGTGQWAFPGEGDTDDAILVDNSSGGDVQVAVYASRGFPPDSFVPPISIAVPKSVEIQSFFKQASKSFSIQNPAYGTVLVGCASGSNGTPAGISSVTVGGVVASQLRAAAGDYGGSRGVRVEWWIAYGVPAGTVTVTVNQGATNGAYTYVLCFQDGVRAGTAAGQYNGYYGGTWYIAQNATKTPNMLLSLASVNGDGGYGTITEGSGSVEHSLDSYSGGSTYGVCRLDYNKNSPPKTWQITVNNGVWVSAEVEVEVYVP